MLNKMATPEITTYVVVAFVWILIYSRETTGCGVIKLEGSAIQGRSIRIVFTPETPPSAEEKSSWFIYEKIKNVNHWTGPYKFTTPMDDNAFILGYETDARAMEVVVQVTIGKPYCSTNQTRFELIVPPEAVDIQQTLNKDSIKKVYTSRVTCYLTHFKAQCTMSLEVDGEPRQIPQWTVRNMSSFISNDTYVVDVNVTKDDNRKELTCAAACEGLQPKRSAGLVILVPYEPIITFDTSTEVSLTEGETFVANCTVDSHPEADITWMNGSRQGGPRREPCGPQSDCLRFEHVSSNHSGNYTCSAQSRISNKLEKRLTIIVHGRPKSSTGEQNTKPMDYLVPVVALSGVVVVLVGIIAVIFVMKTNRSTHETQQPSGYIPSAESGQGAANARNSNNGEPDDAGCYATIANRDTYAQPLPKTLRQKGNTNADGKQDNTPEGSDCTYSTPLPKSQRKQTTTGVTSQQESDVYSKPLPRSQRGIDAVATNTTNVRESRTSCTTHDSVREKEAGQELVYADLEHQTPAGGQPSGMSRRSVDAEVEYMDIDFTKKADRLPDDADDSKV